MWFYFDLIFVANLIQPPYFLNFRRVRIKETIGLTQGHRFFRWCDRRITSASKGIISSVWLGKCLFSPNLREKIGFSPSLLSSLPYLPSLKTSSSRIWKINNGDFVLIIPSVN